MAHAHCVLTASCGASRQMAHGSGSSVGGGSAGGGNSRCANDLRCRHTRYAAAPAAAAAAAATGADEDLISLDACAGWLSHSR